MTQEADTSGTTLTQRALPSRRDGNDLPYRAVRLLADEVVVHLATRKRGTDGRIHPVSDVEVDVDGFTEALLAGDATVPTEMIRRELRKGIAPQTIYLHVLAETARRMGQMWEDDTLSFVAMSVATGRIFSIMRMMRREAAASGLRLDLQPQALFLTVPGETHTLGVSMAADLFRQRGWNITLRTGFTHEELIDSLRDEEHPIIGISAGHPDMIEPLTRLIVALRIVQPQARLIMAGKITDLMSGLRDLLQIDAVLRDGADAEKLFAEFSDQTMPSGR